MIPSQTLEEFEPFAESGDKVAPGPAKYAQGYLPGEVFPAQHENYLMGKMFAPMIVGGFTTVTITSVIIAGIFVGLL